MAVYSFVYCPGYHPLTLPIYAYSCLKRSKSAYLGIKIAPTLAYLKKKQYLCSRKLQRPINHGKETHNTSRK